MTVRATDRWVVRAGRALAPYGLVRLRRRRRRDRDRQRYQELPPAVERDFSYDDLVDALEGLGVPEAVTRLASIPAPNLAFIDERLVAHLASHTPSVGLHIGNFVGVSLVHLAATVGAHSPGSLIIAVDPDLPYRGLDHNQDRVCALLERFGVADRVLLVRGYSDAKMPGAIGAMADAPESSATAAPARVLTNLDRALAPRSLDWALLDGNHDGEYLHAELARLLGVMKPGSLVFLDDCDDSWPEVAAAFDAEGRSAAWRAVATDGRIGVLERTPEAAP